MSPSKKANVKSADSKPGEPPVVQETRAIEHALHVLVCRGWKFSGYFNTEKEIIILGRGPQGETEMVAKITQPYSNPVYEFYVDEHGRYQARL